jgi:hypothetical protein
VGQDSVISVATRYGLDSPVERMPVGQDFQLKSRPALRPIQPPMQWVPGLFPGGKAAEAWLWPLTPSKVEAEERLELYIYSPSGPSWPVLAWTLLLHVKLTTTNQKSLKRKLNYEIDNIIRTHYLLHTSIKRQESECMFTLRPHNRLNVNWMLLRSKKNNASGVK